MMWRNASESYRLRVMTELKVAGAMALVGAGLGAGAQELRIRSAATESRAYLSYPFSRLLPMADECWRESETLSRTDPKCIHRYDQDGDGDVDGVDLQAIRDLAAKHWEAWRNRITENPADAARMIEAMDAMVERMR